MEENNSQIETPVHLRAEYVVVDGDSRLLIEGYFDSDFMQKYLFFRAPYTIGAINHERHEKGKPGFASYIVDNRAQALAITLALKRSLEQTSRHSIEFIE